MKSVPGEIILGDIGGTNARFTFLADDGIGPIEILAVQDYAQFTDAVAAFLVRQRKKRIVARAVFAAAGSYANDVQFSWAIATVTP